MNGKARRRIAPAVVWDNHGCMPLATDERLLPELERYRNAGVDVVSLNIAFGSTPADRALAVLKCMSGWIAARPEHFALAGSVAQIAAAKASGRLAIVFDIEGMDPVVDDPALVASFYALGVRWMLIAYNRGNAAGGGCLDIPDRGLTAKGRAVIDEMERAGMVLCLSHAGEHTVRDALDYATNPPIFSHSNPAADAAHPRNVSDELLRACAAKGGVIGLSGFRPFLGKGGDLVGHLVRQLRHVIDLVGADHVGLGLDYVFDAAELDAYVRANPGLFPFSTDGAGPTMIGPEAMIEIAERLLGSGLNDDAVRGVMGGNWLRIARQVWKDVPREEVPPCAS